MSRRQNSTVAMPMGPKELSAIIQRFDPDLADCVDTEDWLVEVENARLMYHWEERITILYASMRLRGPAEKWFHGAKARLDTWAKFRDELLQFFPTVVDFAKIHKQLDSRRKAKNETTSSYFHNMMALAAKAKVDDKTTMKYIIMGLPSESLRTSLLTQNFASLPQLLRVLIDAEQGNENADDPKQDRRYSKRNFGQNSGRYHPYRHGKKDDNGESQREVHRGAKSEKEQKTTKEQRSSEKLCYKCKKPGHLIAQCPQ
ncbi:uncharacterized protein LOC129796565 [Lutzomyia longipalpis]|uniref:uncharacterized protein LOC129790924 n=1 Tax=Lutzomyia longipalpis TaxID=7200 RepID=UPI0024835BB7|nr:uncharacterized protein LOC129790924 [Lutzomyia longipalpis]XP_055686062.1 uncharacterized protein LOC129791747 [Lutzomyia longipalpis]XP_055694597.1 uncharacterized protein LOC129796565 [Lutzomyia longipalpis]